MIQLFFRQNGETKFVEILPATDERLRSYRQSNRVTVQQVADQVRNQYGAVSEELIIRYLDSMASPR